MQKKVIHIFDDDKFVDIAIDLVENSPDQRFINTYIIVSDELPLKYVKYQKVLIFKRCEFNELVEYINLNSEYLIFHCLDFFKRSVALKTKSSIVKVWLLWGFELYSDWMILKNSIYDRDTKNILNINETFKDKIFNHKNIFKIIKKYFPNQLYRKLYHNDYLDSINTIHYISPIIESEFEIATTINPNLKIIPFTYGYLELFINEEEEKIVTEGNILIGNSADPSNNHISIFKKLSKLDVSGRKIIVPLSYSGNAEYRDKIISLGYKLFGNNFMPLTSFMPLKEYNKLVFSCEFVFFNHIRQQALGNFIILGYNGAKIFFHPKNPVYKHFKKKGFNLFEIDNIINLRQKLSYKEVCKNQEILYNEYNHEFIKNKISIFYNTLFDHHE